MDKYYIFQDTTETLVFKENNGVIVFKSIIDEEWEDSVFCSISSIESTLRINIKECTEIERLLYDLV